MLKKLNVAMAQLLEDFSLVSFVPFNRSDEGSVEAVLATIDSCIQYGEDLEVKTTDVDEGE